MRAVPPYPAPRRPRRAVLALAVFGATSGLIACEGKVGVNPNGRGRQRRRHRYRRHRRWHWQRGRLRHRRLRQRWLRHGRHGRHPGADHAGRVRDLPVRGRRAGRDAAGEAVDVPVPEHRPRSPERERPVGGRHRGRADAGRDPGRQHPRVPRARRAHLQRPHPGLLQRRHRGRQRGDQHQLAADVAGRSVRRHVAAARPAAWTRSSPRSASAPSAARWTRPSSP